MLKVNDLRSESSLIIYVFETSSLRNIYLILTLIFSFKNLTPSFCSVVTFTRPYRFLEPWSFWRWKKSNSFCSSFHTALSKKFWREEPFSFSLDCRYQPQPHKYVNPETFKYPHKVLITRRASSHKYHTLGWEGNPNTNGKCKRLNMKRDFNCKLKTKLKMLWVTHLI